jgi:creatinine amidohydrolase/Fe(II)-dependent formamide hydrolase-like protein
MSVYFADQRSPQLQKAIEANTLIILPVGQVEEHGNHLPVSTDTVIVEGVAQRLAEALVGENLPTLVMPAIWSGYSTRDMVRWPGILRFL